MNEDIAFLLFGLVCFGSFITGVIVFLFIGEYLHDWHVVIVGWAISIGFPMYYAGSVVDFFIRRIN